MSSDQRPQPIYGVIDHYLGEQGQEYFAWQEKTGQALAQYNRHLWQPHIAAHDDILDFGCGGGFLLTTLEGKRKTGVEINPHALAAARAAGLEVYTTVSEVPGYFDKVISSHALEHVPHPREAVLELKAKLSGKHARLLLLLPLDDWRSRSQRRYRSSDVNMHLYAWTPQTLGNLITTCGLKVLQVRVIQHACPPLHSLLWRISPFLFHTTAYLYSGFNRQRQLMAIASLQ